MGALTIDVDAGSPAQGDSVEIRVGVDPAGVALAGVRLRVVLPPDALAAGVAAPGDPADAFAATGPSGAAGALDVVLSPAAPIAAPRELLRVPATVTGLRGLDYRLLVSAQEALDENGVPVELAPGALTLSVAPGAPAILPATLTPAERGARYGAPLVAQGGEPPYTWQLADGSALPDGVLLRDGGVIEGVPTQTGSFPFTVSLTDAAGVAGGQAAFVLPVLPEAPSVTVAALPAAVLGRAYSASLSADGGAGDRVWTADGLPAGLHVQGSRIAGTTTADRAACGVHRVTVTVTESAGPGRSATRSLDLVVLPVAEHRLPVDDPRALVVGRDLHVAEFDVTIGVSAYTPGIDEPTREILQGVLEDLMTDIVTVMGEPELPDRPRGDLPGDPGRPGRDPRPVDPPGPGGGVVDPVPGDDDRPPGGRRPGDERNDLLTALLDEYRTVSDWLRDTVSADAIVQVWIDDVLVKAHHPRLWDRLPGRRRRMHPTRVAVHRRALRRSAQYKRVDALLGKGPQRAALLRRATEHLSARLAAGARPPGLQRIGAKGRDQAPAPAARYFAGPGGGPGLGPGPQFDPWAAIRGALDALADWTLRWTAPLRDAIDQGDDGLLLTVGAHRVRVSVERWVTVVDRGDPVDAASAAAASVAATVRITPRNPDGWPRLAEGLVWSSGGVSDDASQTFVADLGASDLDIVCTTADGVQILPATGDPAAPYAAPRPFSCPPAFAPRTFAAGVQDDIGRSMLVCARDGEVELAVNRGVGGFRRHRLARPSPDDPVGAVAVGSPDAAGWSRLVLLRERAVEVHAGLSVLQQDPPGAPAAAVVTPVRSLVAGDRCTALACYDDSAGRPLVALGFLYGGTVQTHRLAVDGTLGATTRLAGFDTIDHHRQPVALPVTTLEPAGPACLAVVLRQGHALAAVPVAAGLPRPDPVHTPLAASAAVAGPGEGGGVVAVFEPDGAAWWAWWPGAGAPATWLPLVPDGGVRSASSQDGVLAFSVAGAVVAFA